MSRLDETNLDDELEAIHRKKLRAVKVRMILAIVIGIAVLATGIYTKFLRPKSPLGGPCRWAMDCQPEAPACMRESLEGGGVCSRTCDPGVDCAEGIHCISIELDQRDERGLPLKGGYCFPQSYIDIRKAQRRDAGAHR
ncbi:hypothetical protein [Pendulispora albinea]|uniref:Uncharacterized protein n=1 Tax=Pendulispora albinea TaxID=2741071 RepID=A0ABZ2LW92_9BACT